MKSLTSISDLLHNWQDLATVVQTISSNTQNFDYSVGGIQGCLFSYFVRELCKSSHIRSVQSLQYSNASRSSRNEELTILSSDTMLVVPTEQVAEEIASDLATIYPEAEVYVFPWWGLVPYRPAAKGSLVFGKRSGVLSKLAQKDINYTAKEKVRIFIITQRSFIAPLPPPDYISSLCFKLKKGDSLETTTIAERLTKLGYNRVPKVNVRGEFSLRGEVLDIFLPLDEYATRIIFDFDEIESFKSFETDTQVTVGAKEDIFIYPMKEVVWTPELVQKLTAFFEEYEKNTVGNIDKADNVTAPVHLPFTDEAKQIRDDLLLQLEVGGEAEGEEFYYHLLWDKEYTVLDYIFPTVNVIFYDYDRQKNAKLVINREFNGLYRKNREVFPILPPDLIIKDYDLMLEQVLRCIKLCTLNKDEQENNAVLEETRLETDYYYGALKETLESNNYKVASSCDAGNYLCNNIFFRALNFKQKNNLKSIIAFIHIPTIDNIEEIKLLASTILNYIDTLSDVFNIALLQLSPTDSMKNNMLKGIEYCKKAKEMGADIAVFPEMWNTGYEMLFEGDLKGQDKIS